MAKTPNPVDVEIGARLRTFRMQKGMSQTDLAEVAGITFQQIQKYERGTNRMGGSRLVQLAKALGVEPSVLLGQGEGDAENPLVPLLAVSGAVELLRFYSKLGTPQRRLLVQVAAELAPADAPGRSRVDSNVALAQ